MKLSTKTVTSLLVVTTVAAAVPGISTLGRDKSRHESQFDRLLRKHDRKGEISAAILGLSPEEFRQQRKKKTLEQVISSRGMSKRAFRIGLIGYLRNELHERGWSPTRIDSYIQIRSARMAFA